MRRRNLLLAPVAGLLGAAERVPVAATPISRMDTGWWRARHLAKLEEIRSKKVDLIWLGDSITQDWELSGPPEWRNFHPVWEQFYGDRNAVNLGFKGDATSHLLWRMMHGEIDAMRPRAAIVLIGANNLGRVHWNAEQTVAGIDAVITTLRERQPQAGIVLIGVLPSIRSKWVDRMTRDINQELARRYGQGSGVHYADLTGLFVVDGKVDRAQFLDDLLVPPDPPLHPTAQAQHRMAQAIEPIVAQLMGDRPHGA